MTLHIVHHFPDNLRIVLENGAASDLAEIKTQLDKIMAQIDELTSALADLQTAADAAKVRDQAIIDALTALQNNPPAGPDLAPAIQKIKDLITEEGTVGNTPAAPTA